MEIARFKNCFRDVLCLLLLFSVAFLPGCAGKKKVTFVPRKNHTQNNVHKKITPQPGSHQVQEDPVKAKLIKQYISWRGTRYRRGGMTRKGIDCSGFVQITFQNLFHTKVPRTVRDQARMGQEIPRHSLRSGDLVFFKTGIRQRHVGIYLEKDSFMHVSLKKGLTVSKLSDVYWAGRYWKSKRLLQWDQVAVNRAE